MLRILARTLALGLALPTLLSVAPARANLTLPTGFRDSTIYSGIGLPVAMAVLKLPTGAITAFLGLLLMRGQFVPGLSALDTSAQIL